MHRKAWVFIFVLPVLLYSCSSAGRCIGEISTVEYAYWTGPISSPWSEKIVISETSVHLTRTGSRDEGINTGTWDFAVDPQRVALLFGQLKEVDWAAIEAIPPEESLDGGDSTSYTVTCARDSSLSLWYRPGWIYTGGEAITKPVQAFLSELALPLEAARYTSDGPEGQEKEKTVP